ncbi:Acetyltransferase (GNAT) family protein [Alkalibacterium subtropicum]|uniref:Acetyltransferase (GNAT) family protein n=1 Tax=Alkalibacterium subtropicum TaxID=753702 RepID=A0A1I1HFL3_9LACT|nr:GNAT family N-acetyltransferase [Alkalibacterium subtropicum]SFC22807.1 Acetyltransferase (GNAT) family protein [Alkalibacterium subtropicum]
MSIDFRNYTGTAGVTEDYYKVRAFLVESESTQFTYARWDWMITHDYLDKSKLSRIGIWEDSDKIVGIAVFDLFLGTAYCLSFPEYGFLKRELMLYSKVHLSKNGEVGIVIPDSDIYMQKIASGLGFVATGTKEEDSIYYIDKNRQEVTLPKGFSITSLQETFDLYQYYRVLWRGFDHELNGEGTFVFTQENKGSGYEQMIRANVDLNLKIAVVSPEGDFVSYCGIWYEPELDFAVIEPVATDPEYRRMGLGKAAVLEGIRRAGELGAKKVLVGSSQQFYYNIGLRPYSTATEWKVPKSQHR